jgi:transposase
MAQGFDYAAYDALIAEGLSQRQAFERMGVKRSTGQDALKRRQVATIAPTDVVLRPPSAPSDRSVPAGIEDLQGDLIEIAMWWRNRKLRRAQPRQAWDTVRWTIHVDRRWRDRVIDLSDAERASITDVMDRIFREYFEAGSCT